METAEPELFKLNANEESAIVEYGGLDWEVAYEHEPEEHCSTDYGIETIPESYHVYKIGSVFGVNVTEEFIKEKPNILDILSEILTDKMKGN